MKQLSQESLEEVMTEIWSFSKSRNETISMTPTALILPDRKMMTIAFLLMNPWWKPRKQWLRRRK